MATMSESLGHTAQIERLLILMRSGDQQARNRLLEHACQRLRLLAHRMLGRFPKVHRWEETDDVFTEAATRLYRSLASVQPESARHFYNLAAAQIRRVLIDLARKHSGPEGLGANLDTNAVNAQSSTPQVRHEGVDPGEPTDLLQWAEFHAQIERLPEEEREVFSLLWYDGLTQEEAANALSTSVRTIKRRWQSARFLLARACRGELPS